MHGYFWTSPGSTEALLNFVRDYPSSWVKVLRSLCSKLKVEVIDCNSFLGQGGTGRVFQVRKIGGNDQSLFALKLVEHKQVNMLELEWRKLLDIKDYINNLQPGPLTTQLKGVVPTINPDSFSVIYDENSIEKLGAGFLLSPVGQSIYNEERNQNSSNCLIHYLFCISLVLGMVIQDFLMLFGWIIGT
jgi:hypothetical protein